MKKKKFYVVVTQHKQRLDYSYNYVQMNRHAFWVHRELCRDTMVWTEHRDWASGCFLFSRPHAGCTARASPENPQRHGFRVLIKGNLWKLFEKTDKKNGGNWQEKQTRRSVKAEGNHGVSEKTASGISQAFGGKNELLKEKVYFHHGGGPEREPTETTKQMSGFISGI